jgi:hypothetical protein
MKHALFHTLGFGLLLTVALVVSPAQAQTTAPGPYYATPSWDQQLPASTRFIVLSNWGSAAVLDRETGLVWEKSPSADTVNWFTAQYRCKGLTTGNRKGWRLPTIEELSSLVDPSLSPSLPSGHPFDLTSYFFRWSASTVAGQGDVAWGVYFANGVAAVNPKPTECLFWCVRGGQGVDPQ